MNFTSFHWERFEPDIGENLKLEPAKRLYLELACGLTKMQLRRFVRKLDFTDITVDSEEALKIATETKEPIDEVFERLQRGKAADKMAEEWRQFIRIGPGDHTLEDQPLTLRGYLFIALQQRGWFNISELVKAMVDLNSVTGTKALFSERLFGGNFSTPAQKTGADESPMGSR